MSTPGCVKVAIFSKKYCSICRGRPPRFRLHRVKQQCIIHAWLQRKMYIKNQTVFCEDHLDELGQIRLEEYANILHSEKKINSQLSGSIVLIKSLACALAQPKRFYTFERFKDTETLSDDFCRIITGWSKEEFLEFCNYITCMRDSSYWSKYQLIALYRYWLRKKPQQETLAMMFSESTNQKSVSDYLRIAREAIYNDFVPLFLGPQRGREFFLQHNTPTVKILHDLADDDLALVVDGTYVHIEKSVNHEFQYSSYSGQKLTNLIKPFLTCCTDGYIVDIHGPFSAHDNDSSIFKHILSSDEQYLRLLEPNKTLIFMDRGFRDCVSYVRDFSHCIPKMPFCVKKENRKTKKKRKNEYGSDSNDSDSAGSDLSLYDISPETPCQKKQKNSKKLTTEQASETRLVTKVRFIVEQKIGCLKHFRALDNIRNTEIPRIQVDYRIACAMLNFTHRPTITDRNCTEEVARNLKHKSIIDENPLEILLNKQFETRDVLSILLTEINDFPRLTPEQIAKEINFGSCSVENAKSYISIFVNKACFYTLSDIFMKKLTKEKGQQFQETKILACHMYSQYKQGKIKDNDGNEKMKTIYRVYVQYSPNINGPVSIKCGTCTCLSGLRMVGYCAHVIALIYFLSFARYENYYEAASQHKEYIVNIKANDSPSKVIMRRQKRKKNSEKLEFKCNQKGDNKMHKKSNSNDNEKQTESESTANSAKNTNDSSEKNKEKTLDSSTNSNDDKKKENSAKYTTDSSEKNKEKTLDSSTNSNDDKSSAKYLNNDSEFINKFKSHIIPWGGEITYKNKRTKVYNTCTIDYHLLSLWTMFNLAPSFLQSFDHLRQTVFLREIINYIEMKNFNKAKETWIIEILRLDEDLKTISLFNTESEVFTDKLGDFQSYVQYQMCNINCPLNNSYVRNSEGFHIFFNKDLDGNLFTYTGLTHKCRMCDEKTTSRLVFNKMPNFVFIQSMSNYQEIFYQEIPKEIVINDIRFSHISSTLHKQGNQESAAHFIAVYCIFGRDYLVDDLSRSCDLLEPYQKSKNYIRSIENDVYIKNRTTFSCYIRTDILK